MRTALGAAGFTVILAVLASEFWRPIETGHASSERVLSAQEIPDNRYQELIAEGIIEQGEVIEYFYSEGLLSIKEGGSILTNYRVIAYEQDE
ncbi:MAG: hypothetical protein U5K76_01500 [Woeseiaceae bacterium]|nr:hypothetical protein [Woeseiaceae bacterium]